MGLLDRDGQGRHRLTPAEVHGLQRALSAQLRRLAFESFTLRVSRTEPFAPATVTASSAPAAPWCASASAAAALAFAGMARRRVARA
jgi:hypothetical protein